MTGKSIFSGDHKRVISAINKARKAIGITQKELAKKLGKTQSYISKIESAQVRLDIVQLKRIAKVLKVRVQDLMK